MESSLLLLCIDCTQILPSKLVSKYANFNSFRSRLGKAIRLHKVISRFDIALNLILVISRSGSTSMIDLVPSMTVMETKTDFVIPSFSSLMSSFGGALGLWLGLGIIQLVQVSDNYDHYYCQDHVMSIYGH